MGAVTVNCADCAPAGIGMVGGAKTCVELALTVRVVPPCGAAGEMVAWHVVEPAPTRLCGEHATCVTMPCGRMARMYDCELEPPLAVITTGPVGPPASAFTVKDAVV